MRLNFLIIAVFCVLFNTGGLKAQEPDADKGGVLRLLALYLENDTELQNLALKVRQAEIGRDRTGIEKGFDLTLSSGSMHLYSVDGSAAFSVEPKADVSFPGFNSTSLSVSAPITLESDNAGQGVVLENTQVLLSTAIITSAGKQRKVDLLKADRALSEARRVLSNRGLSAEKEFYETLNSLYENIIQALTSEEEAYTKEIELALAQRQGYSPSSVYYRTKQLEAAEAYRTAQEQRRTFEHNTAAFARDCGLAALPALPEIIPAANLDELPEFGQNDEKPRFAEIESALWNSYIGGLSRDAQGTVELSAQGGLTAKNSRLNSTTSADAGLTLGWKGISLSALGQIPLSGAEKNPAVTLSLNFNVNKQRTAALSNTEKRLEAEIEALALKTAERTWEETVDLMRSERADLLWEKKRLEEQYELYRELAEDTTVWYERGVVSESEYRKAIANKDRAYYRILAVDIKSRIHLINSALYFVEK
jgi:hypothetical protein